MPFFRDAQNNACHLQLTDISARRVRQCGKKCHDISDLGKVEAKLSSAGESEKFCLDTCQFPGFQRLEFGEDYIRN